MVTNPHNNFPLIVMFYNRSLQNSSETLHYTNPDSLIDGKPSTALITETFIVTLLVNYLSFLSAGDRIQLDGIRFGRQRPVRAVMISSLPLLLEGYREMVTGRSSRRWISNIHLFVPSSLVVRLREKIWLDVVELWYLLFEKWTVFKISTEIK